MTKRDIALKVTADTDLRQSDVALIIQKTLDYMADELADGNTIEFRNFGVFDVVKRKSRKGRNPNKPEAEVIIPERYIVKFRAGKELKSRVEEIDSSNIR